MVILKKITIPYLFSTLFLLLFVSACSSEASTGQGIARDLLEKDPNSNIFLLNGIVYKKVKDVNVEEFMKIESTKLGEISYKYNKSKVFKEGMATDLTIGTEIFRSVEHPQYVYAIENEVYTLYISIPEG